MHYNLFQEKRNIAYNSIKNFFIFLSFFLVIFFYHKTVIYDRLLLAIIVQLLILAIFIAAIYRVKIAFYVFVFLTPLLNTVTTIIGIRNVNIIFYLFSGLFLGFLVNRYKYVYKNIGVEKGLFEKSGKNENIGIFYETDIAKPVFIFILIVVISAAITIYRYANFVPFITSRFYNLDVNSFGHNSTGAILWTLRYTFYYISGFGVVFIVFNVLREKKDLLTAFFVFLFSSTIVIAVGFYQKYFNPGFGNISFWINAGRVNSTFTDPNALGSYIILIFPLFISSVIFFKKWYLKIISIVLLLLFVYLGFLSGSRNAFLSIIISLFIFAVIGLSMALNRAVGRKIKNPNKSALLSAGVILVIFIIIFSAFAGILLNSNLVNSILKVEDTGIILFDRVKETAGIYYESLKSGGFIQAIREISSGREILWRQAYYMFRDHPASGVGQGAYFIELPDYHLRYHRGFHIIDFSGNYYLQILSELGIVGIVLVLFIFFLLIRKPLGYFLEKNSSATLKKDDWLLAGLVISFTAMAAVFMLGPHTNFIEVQFLFCLVLGLIITYIKVSKKNQVLNLPLNCEVLRGNDKNYKRKPANKKKAGFGSLKIGSLNKIRFDTASIISLVFILISFTATLTYSSVTDLSINYKQAQYSFENDFGFYNEEFGEGRNFRWTAKDASVVLSRKGSRLIIPMRYDSPAKSRIPNFIRIYIDSSLVKIIRLKDDNWHDVEIDLKDFMKKRITLTISMNQSWVPKQYGISNDTRELGIQVGEFEFIE